MQFGNAEVMSLRKGGLAQWYFFEVVMDYDLIKLVTWLTTSNSTPWSLMITQSILITTKFENDIASSGQSYKASTIVNYNSKVVPDWKIPHIMTLES